MTTEAQGGSQVEQKEPVAAGAGAQAEPAAAPAAAPAATAAVAAGAAPVAPVYTPNHKFTVMGQEREFDEFVRASVKDTESEKKLRDLYERAYGLDHVKTKFERTKTELDTLAPKHQQMADTWDYLSALTKAKDFDNLFKGAGIQEQDVYKWVLGKIQAAQGDPSQQQQHAESAETRQRLYMLERENDRLKKDYESTENLRSQAEFRQALEVPSVRPYVQLFDQRAGQPGAFEQQVKAMGLHHFHTTGVDLPPEEVVNRVLAWSGLTTGMPQGAQGPAMPAGAHAAPAASRPAVLPNLGSGRNASPIKQAVKSMADLQKIRDGMEA